MLIRKSFAKQIDGSRPRYLKVPIIPILTKLFFCLWHLSRFMLDPEGMIYQECSKHSVFWCFGDVVICNRLSWSLYSFPPLDSLKNWFECNVIYNNQSSWQLQRVQNELWFALGIEARKQFQSWDRQVLQSKLYVSIQVCRPLSPQKASSKDGNVCTRVCQRGSRQTVSNWNLQPTTDMTKHKVPQHSWPYGDS